MSRTGFDASNFLRYASGIITATPLTISAWFYPTATSGTRAIVGLFNSAGNNLTRHQFILRAVNATVDAGTGDNVAFASSVGAGTFTANTWNHACGTFTSATSRLGYLNGAAGTSNTNSRTPSSIDRTTVGVVDNAAIGQAFDSGGRVAEVAFWNVALTGAEVVSLADGVHPFLVRPDALVAYFPLIGAYSPEINLKSNSSVLTMQGTVTQAAHPRIFQPAYTYNRRRTTAVVGGGSTPTYGTPRLYFGVGF